MDIIKQISLIIGILTLSRVVNVMSKSQYPFCYLTTFSNSITLFTMLTILSNNIDKGLISTASNIAFAMMTAFWFVFITRGKTSVYGKYNASFYEIFTDHFIIPISIIILSFILKSHSKFKKTIINTIILEMIWLLYTIIIGPAYPIFKNNDSTLNIKKLMVYFVLFNILTFIFLYVCHFRKVNN